MRLLKLNRTPRLILLSVVLGVAGAGAAQLLLFLLGLVDTYLLGAIGRYQSLSVEAANAMGAPPEPFAQWYWYMPLSTTLGGLLAGLLIYTLAPETEGHGSDATLNAFHHNNGRMRARAPVVKMLASAITIGSGGSGGLQGPTSQIGSGIGAIVGGLFRLPDDERRMVLLIGLAAGLSAMFKSPLGTAIFAVEILYSRMAFEGSALIYTMISSSVAYAVTGAISGYTPLFLLQPDIRSLLPLDLVWFGLLGLLAGAVGALLPVVYYRVRDAFAALSIPRHFKPAIGGLAVGLIGIAVPPITGGGYGFMQFELQGGSDYGVLLLLLLAFGKILTLSLSVGSGASGGTFGPTLYVGVMLGAAFAALLHLFHVHIETAWLAVVGMAAVFAGAARVPIAAMVIVIEMTGGFQLIMPTMLAVSLAYVVQQTLTLHAKHPTMYEAQVLTPADSPVYRDLYYETAADLLRRQQVHLDDDLLSSELMTALDRGEGLALRHGAERLYSVTLPFGSSVAGREIRSLGLADIGVLIVGLIRGESDIVPGGGTRLQVGDGLLVATSRGSIDQFRKLIAAPQSADEASEGPGES